MNLPKKVEIVEVGPRDGIQNEAKFIETDQKAELINALSKTGIRRMEAASFVHPIHVPQMKDAKQVLESITRKKEIQYMALIPNEKGYERAVQSNVNAVSLVVGASNTFNQKNVRMTTSESMSRLEDVILRAKETGMFVRFNIATSFWCPYEGKVNQKAVLQMLEQLDKLIVDEIVLCDTIGHANPKQVYDLFSRIFDRWPKAKIAAHFHDTYGFAQANILAALQAGVGVFDSSIGGLGGCPFAPGAAGNIATEDLVKMLHEMDIETGIDFDKLLECVDLVKPMTERQLSGHVYRVSRDAFIPNI
ncbi:hydroxymethylglutaryl-CoA lyase [Peribacillus saganii]|uniref:Hydroxymethylglutaryl-CoA lyase n=1 Tax=Peribacillus saganii TaxID=2303992 RepID=A0A372LTT2_9BACI|nr:hydroxymethylglutaryl-CoA lyase [Peribacillus saganii]RFU71466.1 hydroxymethylglutaryl-CoA lyase [Peribacillus saganii]